MFHYGGRSISAGTDHSFLPLRYQQLLGCSKVNLTDTRDYYARYTTSVICNGIVQNSKTPCGLSNEQSLPLCADTCVRTVTLPPQDFVTDFP